MRLVIDDETARASCFGGAYRAPPVSEGGAALSIAFQVQSRGNWCWAAIAAMVATYYGSAVSQAEVAARVLALTPSRSEDPDVARTTDIERRLDHALIAVDCFGHWSAGKPMFDRVRFEINQGRPLAARIGWLDGAAHYILVCGYRDDGERLALLDPLHGPQTVEHVGFPAAYRHGGAWTETLWTRPPAARNDFATTLGGPSERL